MVINCTSNECSTNVEAFFFKAIKNKYSRYCLKELFSLLMTERLFFYNERLKNTKRYILKKIESKIKD